MIDTYEQKVAAKYFENKEKHFDLYFATFKHIAFNAAIKELQGDKHRAEEIVTNVFVKIHHLDDFEFDPTKPHTGYIYTVARRMAVARSKSDMSSSNPIIVESSLGSPSEDEDSCDMLEFLSQKNRDNMNEQETLISEIDRDGKDKAQCRKEKLLKILNYRITSRRDHIDLFIDAKFNEIPYIKLAKIYGTRTLPVDENEAAQQLYGKDYEELTADQKHQIKKDGVGAIKSRVLRIKRRITEEFKREERFKEWAKDKNTKETGEMVIPYKSGRQKVRANLVNGKLHGEAKTYTEDGDLFEVGYYEEGELHGTYTQYDYDGDKRVKVVVGNYKKGEKVGWWISRTRDGSMVVKEDYDTGLEKPGYVEAVNKNGKIVYNEIIPNTEEPEAWRSKIRSKLSEKLSRDTDFPLLLVDSRKSLLVKTERPSPARHL